MWHVLHYCTHLVRPLHRYGEASLCRAGQRPPINVWIGREGHTSNTTCSCPQCLCLRHLEPTGARDGSHSRPGLIMSHHGTQ